jgi:hypothetical protein
VAVPISDIVRHFTVKQSQQADSSFYKHVVEVIEQQLSTHLFIRSDVVRGTGCTKRQVLKYLRWRVTLGEHRSVRLHKQPLMKILCTVHKRQLQGRFEPAYLISETLKTVSGENYNICSIGACLLSAVHGSHLVMVDLPMVP